MCFISSQSLIPYKWCNALTKYLKDKLISITLDTYKWFKQLEAIVLAIFLPSLFYITLTSCLQKKYFNVSTGEFSCINPFRQGKELREASGSALLLRVGWMPLQTGPRAGAPLSAGRVLNVFIKFR